MPKQDQGVEISLGRNRYRVIPRTLVFVTRGHQVLLLHGAPTKRIWANKYNGVGGHIERDEDVFTSAWREVTEETGLEIDRLRLCGVITIDSDHESSGTLLFVFAAEVRSGEPTPSDEGTLEWIDREQILQLDLVEDLKTILPRVLDLPPDEPLFFAHYSYDDRDRLVIQFAESSSP